MEHKRQQTAALGIVAERLMETGRQSSGNYRKAKDVPNGFLACHGCRWDLPENMAAEKVIYPQYSVPILIVQY